jgi:hypothetical protein
MPALIDHPEHAKTLKPKNSHFPTAILLSDGTPVAFCFARNDLRVLSSEQGALPLNYPSGFKISAGIFRI